MNAYQIIQNILCTVQSSYNNYKYGDMWIYLLTSGQFSMWEEGCFSYTQDMDTCSSNALALLYLIMGFFLYFTWNNSHKVHIYIWKENVHSFSIHFYDENVTLF